MAKIKVTVPKPGTKPPLKTAPKGSKGKLMNTVRRP